MTVFPFPVLIWGAGGHAAVVADILMQDTRYRIEGFIDEADPAPRAVLGLTVLGGREAVERAAANGVRHAVVGIGDCAVRLTLSAWLQERGFELVSAVHPRAVLAGSSSVGPGTMVGAGAVVGVRATLGSAVIVNTRASVDHDCVIADGVHVCPGATLAGGVRVGKGAWIGAGATVIDGVSIGPGAVIGAGAVVVRDVESGVVAHGVPARVVRAVS
jgi:sugar O-acyltransferase (sialic acid O-acetyltransferase NeuD family)